MKGFIFEKQVLLFYKIYGFKYIKSEYREVMISQLFSWSLSDEDMQSLASLMSFKPTDIGNLDDFNESDEDEDKKSIGTIGSTGQVLTNSPSGSCLLLQSVFFSFYSSSSSSFSVRLLFLPPVLLPPQPPTLSPAPPVQLRLRPTNETPPDRLCRPQVQLQPPPVVLSVSAEGQYFTLFCHLFRNNVTPFLLIEFFTFHGRSVHSRLVIKATPVLGSKCAVTCHADLSWTRRQE